MFKMVLRGSPESEAARKVREKQSKTKIFAATDFVPSFLPTK